MNEEELYFSYRQKLYDRQRRREGKVIEQMYQVRCIVGSCPVMIDIKAQRFMCLYHKRKAAENPLDPSLRKVDPSPRRGHVR